MLRLTPMLLLAAVLGGCATPNTVTDQTAPLADRLQTQEQRLDGGLHQAMQAATEANRQAALAREMAAALEPRQTALEQRMDHVAQAQDDQTRQLPGLVRDEVTNQLADQLTSQVASQVANQLAAQMATQMAAQLPEQLARSQEELDRRLTQHADAGIAQAVAAAEARLGAENATRSDARMQELFQQLEQRQLQAQQAQDAAWNDRFAQLEKRLAEVTRMAEDALAALGLGPRKIYGKVVHSITLTDDKTLFPINSPDLGEQDLTKLDTVAGYVKKMDVNYHISIHGHTDGLGSDDYNFELGKARAEVVKRYLHEKQGIPLLRMSVISHGATGVTSYREGSNRRIVVEVLQ